MINIVNPESIPDNQELGLEASLLPISAAANLGLDTPIEDHAQQTKLTEGEKTRFAACEAIVRKGYDTFIEVGAALAEIQEHKYYREKFSTFGEYCSVTWGCSQPQAYRLINASVVHQTIKNSPIGEIASELCESHCRELAKLKTPEAQVQAVQEALEAAGDSKLTAAKLKQAVESILPATKQSKTTVQPSTAAVEEIKSHEPVDGDSAVVVAEKAGESEATSVAPVQKTTSWLAGAEDAVLLALLDMAYLTRQLLDEGESLDKTHILDCVDDLNDQISQALDSYTTRNQNQLN